MKKAPTTLKAKRLFRWLTWHRDLESAVAVLSTAQLRELNCYLARAGAVSGVPSLIHGLVLHEAAKRLMEGKGTSL